MSDIVKWGLLVAGAVAIIALIVALPFAGFLDTAELAEGITNIVNIAGGAFGAGRKLINNFLLPFGRDVLSGILLYIFAKWIITIGIKTVTWIYHFIFK